MAEHNHSELTASNAVSDFSVLDILTVLARRKRLIIGIPLAAAVLTAAVSMLLPNIYTGTTRLLPPQQNQSSAAMILGQLSGLAGIGGGGGLGIKNPSDIYVGMLESRTVADNLIKRFDLKKRFDTNTMVETRKELDRASSIAAGKEGIIEISVEDEDPKVAADIANGYVDELTKLSQSLAITDAAQRRLFFERQLKITKDALASAEVALKQTQESTGLIQLDGQAQAVIQAVAELRGQVLVKEVEVNAMQSFATGQNPDYVRAREELAGLKAQLKKLESGTGTGDGNVLIPTGKIPQAGLEYVRKYRDVKYQETVFELLAKQYELAKMDEAREASLIQVLDKAVPLDKKSKPRRSMLVIVAALLAGVLVVCYVVATWLYRRIIDDPSEGVRLRQFVAAFRAR